MAELLLMSGGVESATLLHLPSGAERRALFIDYGQRAAARERSAAQALCADAGVPVTALDMAAVGEAFRAGRSQRLHVPLPHRNLVALSLGVSYAAQLGADRVLIALNRDDTEAYASASPAFLDAFGATSRLLDGIGIGAPLIGLTKAGVVRQGAALGIDYTRSWSCLLDHPRHCGRCPQCLKRRAAFAAAGVVEPVGFYEGS